MDYSFDQNRARASVVKVTTAPAMMLRADVWQLPAATVLAALAVLAAGVGPATVPLLYLAAVTPALCTADVVHRRLPNRVVLPAYVVLLVAIVTEFALSTDVAVAAVISGLAYFGFMLVLNAAGGMGMGDVKLAGALGLSAGMYGLETALVSPLLAFLAGGVAAAVALIVARGRSGTRIPFGPFMLACFWASVMLQR